MDKKNNILLALVTGLLLALSFPPMPFGNLAFVAFVPLLFWLEQQHKRQLLIIYLVFFIYHAGANWWISSWQAETDPYLFISGLAVALVHPFLFLFPFLIYRMIRRRIDFNQAIWYFPFIWISFEWLHSISDLAYPWLNIGYTQTLNLNWVQFADIAGVYGVGFVIVLINVILLKTIFLLRELTPDRKKLNILIKNRNFQKLIIPLISLIIIPYIYGALRVNQFVHQKLIEGNQIIKVGIIQPTINPWQKWEMSASQQVYKHMHIQDSLISTGAKPDLFLWSETAVLKLSLKMNADHDFSPLQGWINGYKTSLLTGYADMYFYKPGEKPSIAAKAYMNDTTMVYDSYNSALLLNPAPSDKLNPQIYHKMKLTPFGERIPFMEVFSFLRKWIEWGVGISSWDRGKEQKLLTMENNGKTAKIAPIICIESIFPGFVRDFVNLNADFITIITNDAWYDYTFGPEQHFQIAVMRAIENRRYVARSANSGVSGIIGADGRTLSRAEQYKSIGFCGEVVCLKEKSIYTQFGDWLAFLCLAVTAFGLITVWMKQRIK
jgi:apolipoprotein N-acyltransferase